jgi:hypothetical protein
MAEQRILGWQIARLVVQVAVKVLRSQRECHLLV